MQVVKDFFENNNIHSKKIAVGVSGGADSLALVLMLKEELKDTQIIALTVDHGLRPTSKDEALYVKKIMDDYEIEHHILSWEGDKPKIGIEEQARIARYNLLTEWCKTNDVNYLCIAHHILDQAETFLMRLERGSGVFGLSSMKEISDRNGIFILRPLLKYNPCYMKDYLKNKNISWVNDESNDCDDFLRVRMRKFLPILDSKTGISAERIYKAVENLQRTRSFLEYSVNLTIENHTVCWNNIAYSFDYSKFLLWHNEVSFHLIGKIIKELSESYYTPESDILLKLLNNMRKKDFESFTLGGCIILKDNLKIWIIKEYRDKSFSYTTTDWNNFIKQNPIFRGIKLPHKLKTALLREKK